MNIWFKWHRRIGLAVAPILLMLAITGVLINHVDSLGWQARQVYSSVIASLYGIPSQTVTGGIPLEGQLKNQWLYQVGTDIFLDTNPITQCEQSLVGGVLRRQSLAVLCEDRLLLLTLQGELIEQIPTLPAPLTALGHTGEETLVVQAQERVGKSGKQWQFDESNGDWLSVSGDDKAQWSQFQSLPAAMSAQVNADIPIPGLTQERVLLDLHSGRLFGQWGVWVVDASGVLLVFLIFSGVFTWLLRTLKRRKKKR